MSSATAITDVFAALASFLQSPNPGGDEDASVGIAIAKLNTSLNLEGADDPAARFLDTALSLMCFTAPKVFDSLIERLVRTIVAALSSSSSCRVFKFGKREALLIGSSILERDRAGVIKACVNVLANLNENDVSGEYSRMLVDAVIRATFSASRCQYLFQTHSVHDTDLAQCGRPAALMLLNHLPREFSLDKDEIPLRLLLWHIDPLVLKHCVSQILQEIILRPFLCLEQEFHKRTEWRMIITCLALCPVMLIETRTLVHKWFLQTGAAFLLEFLIDFVKVMLDVSSRPTWWGMSTELGLKLPFSSSYFLFKQCLLRTLAGPVTSSNFLDLVHSTCKDSVEEPRAMKMAMLDHKSSWALAINFPIWFCYASVSLFCGKSFEGIGRKTEKTCGMEPLPGSTSAARYISWILDPINENQREHLVDCLIKNSESWILRQSASGQTEQATSATWKKLKKSKLRSSVISSSLQESLQNVVSWLEKFDTVSDTFWPQNVGPLNKPSIMFRSMPLGILIAWPEDMNGPLCELLLYYASTGRIFWSKQTKFKASKDSTEGCRGFQESAEWIDQCNVDDTVTGANLVFRFTDIVVSMSGPLFDTEESRINFVSRFKERVYGFLIKCIKRLMSNLDILKDGFTMTSDLYSRLSRWKNQGQELINFREDFNDVITRLKSNLSATEKL